MYAKYSGTSGYCHSEADSAQMAMEEREARVLELVLHRRWLVQAQLSLVTDGRSHHEVHQPLSVTLWPAFS